MNELQNISLIPERLGFGIASEMTFVDSSYAHKLFPFSHVSLLCARELGGALQLRLGNLLAVPVIYATCASLRELDPNLGSASDHAGNMKT